VIFSNEIRECIKNLEASFAKKYNTAQQLLLEEHLGNATKEQLALLVKKLVDSQRTLPLPQVVQKTLKFVQRENPREEEGQEEYKIKCQFCMDTGWVFSMIESSVDVLLKCSCEKGKENLDQFHPVLDADTKPFLRTFPATRFRPGNREKMQDKIEWWTTTKKISAEYWKSQLDEKPEPIPY